MKKGIFNDSYIGNILIKGFCDVGLLEFVGWVLNILIKNGGIVDSFFDVVSVNILIDGYCKVGLINNVF